MAEIKVKPQELVDKSSTLQDVYQRISSILSEFNGITSNLDWDIGELNAYGSISRRLSNIRVDLQDESYPVSKMSQFLAESATKYHDTESSLLNNFVESGSTGTIAATKFDASMLAPKKRESIWEYFQNHFGLKLLEKIPLTSVLAYILKIIGGVDQIYKSNGNESSILEGLSEIVEYGGKGIEELAKWYKSGTKDIGSDVIVKVSKKAELLEKWFPSANSGPVSKFLRKTVDDGLSLGTIFEFAGNALSNAAEWRRGEITGSRAVLETFVETGVDIVKGALISTAVAAILPASAPVLAVAVLGATMTIGIDAVSNHFTGKKATEAISDWLINQGEIASKTVVNCSDLGPYGINDYVNCSYAYNIGP